MYMLAHNGIFAMNSVTAGKTYIDDFCKLQGKHPVFRYERIFFTMLDAYHPAKSHWTLKAPNYAHYFPTIFEEYPDARIVLTHRNPVVTLPSFCRLTESFLLPFDKKNSFDKYRFGQFQQTHFEKCFMVPFTYRKKNLEKEEHIFDCVYEELFSDPIAVVKKIYRKFDLDYTHEFEEKMKIYLKSNKQGKYGRHKYTLEEYGFRKETIYKRYKDYIDHYGFDIPVKLERPESFDFSL